MQLHTKSWSLDGLTGHSEAKAVPCSKECGNHVSLSMHLPHHFHHILQLRQSVLLLILYSRNSCRSTRFLRRIANEQFTPEIPEEKKKKVCFIYGYVFVFQKRTAELTFMDWSQHEAHKSNREIENELTGSHWIISIWIGLK